MQTVAHFRVISGLMTALVASFALLAAGAPVTVSADTDPEAEEEEEREEGQRRPSADLGSYRVGAPRSSSSLGRMDREQMRQEEMEFEREGLGRSGFSMEPEFGSSGVGMDLDIRPSRSEDSSDRQVVDEERSTTDEEIEQGLVENQDVRPVAIEAPRYPTRAYRSNIEGFAVVEFTVDVYGDTQDVRVVDSSPGDIFDDAARSAVESWRFEPRVVDGRPVATEVREIIDFDLDR